MKNKQRARIVSIEHLNKNFEVKTINCPTDPFTIDGGADGNVSLPLPREKLSDYFEVGDVIEFKKHGNHDYKIINLTCEELRLSRFKRDLTSVLRRLDRNDHPMKRCILLNEKGFVLLSTKKNPEKVSLIFEATNIRENNNEKF
jgi:hypothetical protein